MVKRYDPDSYFVQFYKVEPKDKVGIITVQCIEVEKDLTEVEVTYEYKGLSNQGNEFIIAFDSDHYEVFINEWESLLNTYFQSKR